MRATEFLNEFHSFNENSFGYVSDDLGVPHTFPYSFVYLLELHFIRNKKNRRFSTYLFTSKNGPTFEVRFITILLSPECFVHCKICNLLVGKCKAHDNNKTTNLRVWYLVLDRLASCIMTRWQVRKWMQCAFHRSWCIPQLTLQCFCIKF